MGPYFPSVTCLLQTPVLLFTVYDKHDNPLTSEEEEQRAIAKIKMLGNIKFIGELGKLDLIHESILHKCIKTVRAPSCVRYSKTRATRLLTCSTRSFPAASGKEEESPAQGYGGGSGVPLSDNENCGAETRPRESEGKSFGI